MSPSRPTRALEHFFSPANLTALRELALRRTADRVDEQLLTQMQARAIAGPWPAGERVLVCISEDPRAVGLVRYAKRLADRLRAPWTALYVETRRSTQLNEEQRDRVADTLRLVQSLEGEPVTIPGGGRRVADDVIAYAQANNITHIIIGKSSRSRWFEILHGSVVHDLVRGSGNISGPCHRRRRAGGRADTEKDRAGRELRPTARLRRPCSARSLPSRSLLASAS